MEILLVILLSVIWAFIGYKMLWREEMAELHFRLDTKEIDKKILDQIDLKIDDQ